MRRADHIQEQSHEFRIFRQQIVPNEFQQLTCIDLRAEFYLKLALTVGELSLVFGWRSESCRNPLKFGIEVPGTDQR